MQPSSIAEDNLCELITKATFQNIKSVLKPLMTHLDHHKLWDTDTDEPNEFVMHIFRMIMDSVQSTHAYAVIQVIHATLGFAVLTSILADPDATSGHERIERPTAHSGPRSID